jgi:hypothetical protein
MVEDMSRSLYRINGTERTVRVTPEFAARFGGMTLVAEDADSTPAPSPTKARAKATPKTDSSKEGK